MPVESAKPFLFVREIQPSLFSFGSQIGYEWTQSDACDAIDISDWLLLYIKHFSISFYIKFLALKKKPPRNLSQFKDKKLIISCDYLNQLGFELQAHEVIKMAASLAKLIKKLLLQNCTIGLDFIEIFFAKSDEDCPSHYRPNIDVVTNCDDIYKRHVNGLSYQLARQLFDVCAVYYNVESELTEIISKHYSRNKKKLERASLNRPVNTLFFHDSIHECIHYHNDNSNYRDSSFIYALDYPVSYLDLKYLFIDAIKHLLPETIVVLRDPKFIDSTCRDKAHQHILALLKEFKFPHMIHFIFLTKTNISASLLDLAPSMDNSSSGYQALAEDAGYYLSAADVTAVLFANNRHRENDYSRYYSNVMQLFNVPTKPKSAFILALYPHQDMRPSKQQTSKQITAQVAVSQQQSMGHVIATTQEQVQLQEQTEIQSIAKQISKNVSQDISHSGWSFEFKVSFTVFCEKIKEYADKCLIDSDRLSHYKPNLYMSQYYSANYDIARIVRLLATSVKARMQLAAKVYGMALVPDASKPEGVAALHLPHYSIDYIDASPVLKLICLWTLANININAEPMQRKIIESQFFGKVLTDFKFDGCFRHHGSYDLSQNNLTNQSLQHALKTGNSRYYSSITANLLLPDSHLFNQLPEGQRQSLNDKANRLITLYQSNAPTCPVVLKSLVTDLFDVIAAHIPEEKTALDILADIIARFDFDNTNHLTLLLEVVLYGHTVGLQYFAAVISALHIRALIPFFFRYYFQYALRLDELRLALGSPASNQLRELIKLTPIGLNKDKWPFNVALGLELCLLSKASNQCPSGDMEYFQQFCQRLHAKFYAYTGDEAEVLRLMDKLKYQMIGDEGLRVSGFSKISAFCNDLEILLDHAIAKQVLEEQIDEIKHLSLLPTDAMYAIAWNGFQLICDEMAVKSSAINPSTARYSVTKDELLSAIVAHDSNDTSLKQMLFRYLGTESMREDMAYYRKLYQAISEASPDDETRVVNRQLCAFYTILFTGCGYGQAFDTHRFKQQCVAMGLQGKEAKLLEGCTQLLHQLAQIPKKEQLGIHTIWSMCKQEHLPLNVKPGKTVPAIFLRGFNQNCIGHFLISQRESLQAGMVDCYDNKHLSWMLIKYWCKAKGIQIHFELIQKYIQAYHSQFDWDALFNHVNLIARLINAISSLIICYPESLIYLAINELIEGKPDFNVLLLLLERLAHTLSKYKNHFDIQLRATQFVFQLVAYPLLYTILPKGESYFNALLQAYLLTESSDAPIFIFDIALTLTTLDLAQAELVFEALTPLFDNPAGIALLSTKPQLTAAMLQGIVKLMDSIPDLASALYLITAIIEQQPSCDLDELTTFIKQYPALTQDVFIALTQILSTKMQVNVFDCLKILSKYHVAHLQSCLQLVQFYSTSPEDLIGILESPDVVSSIRRFKENKRQENLDRYRFNPDLVKAKIAEIRCKSTDNTNDRPLSAFEQAALWKDYQLVMAYMLETPILIELQGQTQRCNMNNIDDDDFKVLFKIIKYQLSRGNNRHAYQLIVIALSVEAMYRCTHKFPRYTQILTTLEYIRNPNNIIHEYETGQGKSIITALHAVLLWVDGYSVDIATENNKLAYEGLTTFSGFYDYLGIPHGAGVLMPTSAFNDYVSDGINYSTPANLALFRIQMAIARHDLPTNVALIADEIDAALTTTVQYRLASVLDSSFYDTESWTQIYLLTLAFIQEQEIFVKNCCSKSDDVSNLRHYFIYKKSDKTLLKIIDNLTNEQLSTLIDAAMISYHLKEKDDYLRVIVKVLGHKNYYAAPIIASTHRPDPNVSYSSFVQQIIHAMHNRNQPRYPFVVEPCTETLVVISASNFFSDYRLNNGPIIGLTATADSPNELLEFNQQQGLQAFNFPSYHDNQRQDLGLIAVFDEHAHRQATHRWLLTQKAQYPTQPVLLFTPSPEATDLLMQYLTQHSAWAIQRYHGFEMNGCSEEQIILIAGLDNGLTVSNQSMARGTDIIPTHDSGIVVVNLIADLTPSELMQMYGRAGRNGKPGQQISIINAQHFAKSSDSLDVIALKFKQHQQQVSLIRQQQRQKTRLLEEIRHHLVTKHLLKLRQQADRYLTPQFGEHYSLVDQDQLGQALSQLNKQLETQYHLLLQQHSDNSEVLRQSFLRFSVDAYQAILNKWLPNNNFEAVELVEPSIPLANLAKFVPQLGHLTLDQLCIVATLPHQVWRTFGHQSMHEMMTEISSWLLPFDPYFKGRCSFKHNLGEVIDGKGYFTEANQKIAIEKLQEVINTLVKMAEEIPVIGYIVPKESVTTFFDDYLKTTQQQIKDKQWEQLSLPQYNLTAITTWLGRVSTALKVVGYASDVSSLAMGGPVAFIIKRYVVPAVISWLKQIIKHLFAQSDNILAQLLVAIDDIAIELPKVISALVELSSKSNVTVGYVIDNFGGLVKNKALKLIVIKVLELYKLDKYILAFNMLPAVIDKLDAYRDKKLETVFTIETLLLCLQYAADSPMVKDLLADNQFQQSFQILSQLSPDAIRRMAALNIAEFMQLVPVLSHPTFFAFMQKLPPDLNYAAMVDGLNQLESARTDITSAVDELLAYQNDRERIALENKQALQQLSVQHQLTEQTLATELEKLAPRFLPKPCEAAPKLKQSSRFWSIIGWKDVMAAIALAALIAVTVLYFSPVMLLVSLCLSAFILAPYAYRLGQWAYHKLTCERGVKSTSEQPIILSDTALGPQSRRKPMTDILGAKVLDTAPDVVPPKHFPPMFAPSSGERCNIISVKLAVI